METSLDLLHERLVRARVYSRTPSWIDSNSILVDGSEIQMAWYESAELLQEKSITEMAGKTRSRKRKRHGSICTENQRNQKHIWLWRRKELMRLRKWAQGIFLKSVTNWSLIYWWHRKTWRITSKRKRYSMDEQKEHLMMEKETLISKSKI